ncbi:sigma-54-dependent Fis family transcriptional regulator, partial [bacterium]|nr:sigma-54-dependent Fis family transcriptional regulator [bacterium]
SKLLRVLEGRRFQRLGGNADIAVDVRLVAATNQDVRQALASGRLREDLYHRLNVVQIVFPPLRERGDDLELLARHFLAQFTAALGKRITAFTEPALRQMRASHWPGNIRELRNAVERAVIVETSDQIQTASLPTGVGQAIGPAGDAAPPANLEEAVAAYERALIERALQQNRGRIGETATALGISRHALRYRMQKLGMNVGEALDRE